MPECYSCVTRASYNFKHLNSLHKGVHNNAIRKIQLTEQRRSQNEAEEAMPPPKKLVKIFRWCFISISTVRKQT